MKSVQFDEYDTYEDFGLILTSKKIGTPKVKSKKIRIEGADGELDYTDFFGEPKFENRELEFEFQIKARPTEFVKIHSEVLNALNGKQVRIVLEDDPDFYYVGRLTVSDLTPSGIKANINISCDCEPYKYKLEVTTVSQAVSGSASIVLNNLRKRVVPKITTDAEFNFSWGKFSTTVSAGTFQLHEFELVAGGNLITVEGTGNVTFEYQEGGM